MSCNVVAMWSSVEQGPGTHTVIAAVTIKGATSEKEEQVFPPKMSVLNGAQLSLHTVQFDYNEHLQVSGL